MLTIPEGGCLTLSYWVPLSAETDLAGGEGVRLVFQDVLPKPVVRGLASQGSGSGRSWFAHASFVPSLPSPIP